MSPVPADQRATLDRFPSAPVTVAALLAFACALAWVVVRLAGVPPSEEPRVRVGLVAVPEQEPLAVARARGALDPAHVLVVEFLSLEDLRNALLDGNVQAGVFPLDDALWLTGSPANARIEHFVGVSHAPLALLTRSDIPALAGLRGRRIGLESGRRCMGALGELLARGGLSLGDVRLEQVDADSAPLALEQGQVDAVLTYAPVSLRMTRAGARTLACWEPLADRELIVLVASERAHRVAAGQLSHLAQAWFIGARALQRPDSAMTALISRREGIVPADVAGVLATQHYLGPEDDRRLGEHEGVQVVDAALSTIVSRWRALGVPDTLPSRERWLVPARKRS